MAVNPSSSDPGRWTLAVRKLVKLTREGRITWTKGQPRPKTGLLALLESGPEDVYDAQHDDQRLRFRRWVNARTGIVGGLGLGGYQYALEMVDKDGDTVWTFPTVSDLADLYQAIRFYEAGVGPYIDKLLAEP